MIQVVLFAGGGGGGGGGPTQCPFFQLQVCQGGVEAQAVWFLSAEHGTVPMTLETEPPEAFGWFGDFFR